MKKINIARKIKFYLKNKEEKRSKKEIRRLKSVLMDIGLIKCNRLVQEIANREYGSN